LITVPLNRSHLKGAVELHRAAKAYCYRGKDARYVLRAFYDAYANRDYTVGTAGLEGERVVGVACGTTDLAAPGEWLRRRRPWRSLPARLAGGENMARGGWGNEFPADAGAQGRPVYLLSAVAAEALSDEDIANLFGNFAAAAASRGADRIFAPAVAADDRLLQVGFEQAEGLASGEGVPLLYVRGL